MTVAQRIEYLLDQVPRGPGVGGGFPRLESLLEKIELGGELDEGLRRKLIEIHQIRNVYAHRGGITDRKARAACPWRRDWRLGRQLRVSGSHYRDYVGALHEYAYELIVRSGAKFDFDVRAHTERVLASQNRDSASTAKKSS
jgi:hypothetical protein